jgi:hypothetical protein
MKPRHALAFAAMLLLAAGAACAADYTITRPQVQLWSGPGDDMRPQIDGDVVAFSAASVDLDGGVTVPVRGARVDIGQHATFACELIDLPAIRGCVLVSVQSAERPQRKGEAVKLW